MYSRASQPIREGVERLRGYVTVQQDPNDGSDDESDGEDDDDWLDDKEMSAIALGGTLLKQTVPKNQRLTIKSFADHGRSYVVKGRFPLSDPWWKITCFIYQNRSSPNRHFVDHTRPIVYEIRADKLVVQHKLINLCLTNSQADILKTEQDRAIWNDQLTAFDKYCQQNPGESLYFDNMKNLIRKFDEVSVNYESTPIWTEVKNLGPVQLVLNAVAHPDLFQFIGQLLPRKFIEMFKNLQSSRLESLNSCREEYPWEFGFSSIMFKQYGLIGIEATLHDFLRCDLLSDMPTIYNDALYIYDFLKKDARQNGHTFIEKFRIRKSKFCSDYQVVNWETSIKYLEQHKIVKTEGKDQMMKIYLRRNWEAERDVAKNLGEMLKNGSQENWEVDFTSCDFDNLHGDEDQWRAAHLITNNPVAVLSGKGGCGKTTVVTQLLRHVCENTKAPIPVIEAPVDPDTNNEDDVTTINGTASETVDFTNETTSESHWEAPWNNHSELSRTRVSSDQEDEGEDDSDDEDDHYLSKTVIGKTILLAAPTGKAANLLGRKAGMESVTLHHIIMSYKGFCKRKADYLREKNESNRMTEKSDEGENESLDQSVTDLSFNEDDDELELENGSQSNIQLDVNNSQNADQILDANSENNTENEPILPNRDPEMPVWKYEDKSVLVVDECSLVSVRTISTVLNNLKRHAKLRKVILLGDVRQLPSVEPGNFLCDIFRVLYPVGCCMELRTNHRAESELIVNNATKISLMKLPSYDRRKFQLREIGLHEGDVEIDDKIKYLLQKSSDLNQETSQFVSFQRKRCESINELCCKFYNKHNIRDDKNKYLFRTGDKVCMSKNGDVVNHKDRLPRKPKKKLKQTNSGSTTTQASQIRENHNLTALEVTQLLDLDDDESILQSARHGNTTIVQNGGMSEVKQKKKEKKNKAVKLCNGEVFFIINDVTEEKNGKSERYLTLSDREQPKEKIVCVNYRELTRKCKMRHGWARTIHTYQGSESQAVVYVVYRSMFENWQHVYTAVTRGRNSVYMVGKKCNIDRAIRTDKKDRRTSLKDKLLERVDKFPEILQKFKETLEELLENSEQKRKQKIENGEDGEADLFDSDDDNYINAICDLLPNSQSESMADNSLLITDNSLLMDISESQEFGMLTQKVIKPHHDDQNQMSFSGSETNSIHMETSSDHSMTKADDSNSCFDSDDSYMKNIDESTFIANSQLPQTMTEFTQYRNQSAEWTQEYQNNKEPVCSMSTDLANQQVHKRHVTESGDAESPPKAQRIFDSSIFVSPVRRSLEKFLSVSKK